MRTFKTKFISTILLLVIVCLFGVRAYNGYRFHLEKETRFLMDTYVTIYALGPKKVSAKAIDLAMDRMQEIDVKFNHLNSRSPVYAFNHRGEPIVDPEILGLLELALDVSKKTDGAFDITVEPLVELWGFYSKSYYVPTDDEIKACLARVGYKHLILEKGRLEKDDPATRIDLGGIAKGYAVSEAVRVLKSQGVASALLDVGGDIYALGKKGRRLWKVGIKDPRGEDILGYVEVEDLAVLGSGDYERFFIKDDKRYHHIFDPHTGYPAQGTSSVTLIYGDPVTAQAWTKIPFVVGPKKGLELLESIPGMEVIIVTSSGETLYSTGLKHVLNVVEKDK